MDIQHTNPAWSNKADFAVGATITDDWRPEYSAEQLAAQQLPNGRYMICSIPFAAYSINLGDIVTLDETYTIKEVVERSIYVGFRIATTNPSEQDEVINRLASMTPDFFHEEFNKALMSLAVPKIVAHDVADLLVKLEESGKIKQYETIEA